MPLTMRALVVEAPQRASVQDVARPRAAAGQVVVEVERVGVCGTDMEFFTGSMAYLRTGAATYPVRIGHEWSGVVASAGDARGEAWLGRRVTGDTMLGCGRCARCMSGRHHVCANRFEIGIRGGWPGAVAEQLLVPVDALRALPDAVDAKAGALVEPGGNAWRAFDAAHVERGERLLVLGPGTIGLLVGMIARSQGVEVHLMGRSPASLDFARGLDFQHVWTQEDLPDTPFHAVVDASNAAELPAFAVDHVEPARRAVLIGLAGEPSHIDSRDVTLNDVTLVGILAASAGLTPAIELYASGAVDPRPLVAATVPLGAAASVLAGERGAGWGSGPKIYIDPRR